MRNDSGISQDAFSAFIRQHIWIIGACCIAFVLVSRLPAINHRAEINRDESQMVAQAMRFAHDLMPWRAVDGTTSGPVNSWFLLGARALGLKLDHQSAHAMAAVTLAAALLGLFFASRRHFGSIAATIALAIAAAWLAFNQGPDFVHYSSEIVPLLLLSLALLFGESSLMGACIGAFLLGLVPWAKLQAGPIAAVVGLWLVFTTFRAATAGCMRVNRWIAVMLVGAAALLPSAVILGAIIRAGVTEDFVRSYFIANLYYAGPLSIKKLVLHLVRFASVEAVTPWLLVVGSLFVTALFRLRRDIRNVPPVVAFGAILMAFSLLICGRSQTFFPHYQLLLVPGLFLCTASTAWLFGKIGARPAGYAALAVAVFAAVQLGGALRGVRNLQQGSEPSAASRVIRKVRQVTPNLGSVGIWGWAPALYVELQATPPTRHAICHYLIEPSPSREFFRVSFMRDLRASMPAVILDLSEAYNGQSQDKSVASFAELQTFLRENYVPPVRVAVPDVVVDEGGDLRSAPAVGRPLELSIYVRRDNLAKR